MQVPSLYRAIKRVVFQLFILGFFLLPTLGQVELSSSKLPIVIIDTDGQEIVDDPRIQARMGIIYNGPGQINQRDDLHNNYSGRISIEIRGSTSQDQPKKSYSLETQMLNGDNLNVSLLDMPEENDWVLQGPYPDKTLIRNILVYQLFGEMGHYSPRTSLCELILNGEYRGVYVLTEKIKRDKNRVDIAKLNPDEISGDSLTGGYIIKIDKVNGSSGSPWTSDRGGIYFQYEYPKHDEIVQEQKDYIQGYINEFETALTGQNFTDSILGYRKYLNLGSAVDLFIVNEISKNVDAYMMSSFFYKDKDSKGGKLCMGPVWDYNLSLGNADYREGYMASGFQLFVNQSIWWWDHLMEDPSFVSEISERWLQLRTSTLTHKRVQGLIDSLATVLDGAQQRNFEQWDILGYYIWPNYYVGNSYVDEVNYLKNWIGNRIQWLDKTLHDWTSAELNFASMDHRVYPNPFREEFVYSFSLSEAAKVSVHLTDLQGRKIRTISASSKLLPGKQSIHWETPGLESGVYLLYLEVKGRIESVEKVICH